MCEGKCQNRCATIKCPPTKSGRVIPMADGQAAIIVTGGESPTYEEMVAAGWIEPLTHPERTAQVCEPVKIPVRSEDDNDVAVLELRTNDARSIGPHAAAAMPANIGAFISIVASGLAQQVMEDIKSLSPWPRVRLPVTPGLAYLDDSDIRAASRAAAAIDALELPQLTNAEYELHKLIQKVGIENWTRGDFVVLSMDKAQDIADNIDPAGMGLALRQKLQHQIDKARQ